MSFDFQTIHLSTNMEYDIKWGNYQKWTVDCVKDLYGDEKFADVTLLSDDLHSFKAHRIILSSSSEFFEKIFTQMSSPIVLNNNSLFLKGVKGKTLQTMLEFIYQGFVSVQQEDLSTFLETGFDLQVTGIISGNESVMRERKSKSVDFIKEETLQAKNDEEPDEVASATAFIEQENCGNPEERQIDTDVEDDNLLDLQIAEESEGVEMGELDEDINDSHEGEGMAQNGVVIKSGHVPVELGVSKKKRGRKGMTYVKSESEAKPVVCEECLKRFPNQNQMRMHFDRKHNGMEKKFPCDTCGKKFYMPQDVKAHIKGVHLKIKDFACDLCDRAFSQKCNLKSHKMKMHSALV